MCLCLSFATPLYNTLPEWNKCSTSDAGDRTSEFFCADGNLLWRLWCFPNYYSAGRTRIRRLQRRKGQPCVLIPLKLESLHVRSRYITMENHLFLTPLRTILTMMQGEPCSSCPSLGVMPANLIPGVQAQTLQHKGEKGEPGIGQKGVQVRWVKAIRSTIDCGEILSTFFAYQGEPGTVGLPGSSGLKVSNTKKRNGNTSRRPVWPTRGLTQWDAEWSL